MDAPEGYEWVDLPVGGVAPAVSAWGCKECGAMVPAHDVPKNLHDQWHDRIDRLTAGDREDF